jgi:Leucine-rich repeat (LRR) protein
MSSADEKMENMEEVNVEQEQTSDSGSTQATKKMKCELAAVTSDVESDVEVAGNGKEEEAEELCILDPDAFDVDLNHGRIAKIENLEGLRQVETLCLRWNLIKKIENLSMLTTLKELEFYDNQVCRCYKQFGTCKFL